MSEQEQQSKDALSLSDKLAIYETFRKYIAHEDDLTNNRITWMLTIHGFLYASYGFTLQKKLEVLDKINSFVIDRDLTFADYIAQSKLWLAWLDVEVFLVIIAGVGMAISWYALQSVRSAAHALNSTRFLFELKFFTFPVSRERKCKITEEEARAISGKVRDIELIESVIDIGPANCEILIPTITGGGHQALHRGGVSAALMIPIVLFISWIVALLLSGLYFLSNLSTIEKLLGTG